MKNPAYSVVCSLALAILIATPAAWARKQQPPPPPLTEKGKELFARYNEMLSTLKTELKSSIPAIPPACKKAYLDARAAEKAAEAKLNKARDNLAEIGRARGLVGHAKGKWIGGADKGIKQAREKLKRAKTEAERQAARAELAKWQKNREDGVKALKERQARLDRALAMEPTWKKELAAAEKELERARANTRLAIRKLGLDSFLAKSDLDAKLAKFVVLNEAGPRRLAAFAQQSAEHQQLVEKLLADNRLMLQMAVADGAREGQYGPAAVIYSRIRKKFPKSAGGVLQRLALAIALEHAVPIPQRNPVAATDAPKTVDPVNRYRQFETAYLNGELDPAFKTFSTWDLRMVVDGNEPDDTLVWGREMLRNYRPDHITNPDYRWRYVGAVRTEIRYGSQYNKFDRDDLQFFQNILANGGVCGRRAFFGRFILRAFGIPTTARPQRGHAALAHWTPKGWVVCLGGGWGAGWTKTRYNRDRDFLANTQARQNPKAFLQVKRAQWIGDLMGEKPVYGFFSGDPGFWYGISLYRQQAIIEDAKAVALAAVGEDLGEANESKVKEAIKNSSIPSECRKITVAANGVITIPAVACTRPTNNTRRIKFMKSNLGGMQLHYSRLGGPETFEYTVDVPRAGTYQLTARVVTPTPKQLLVVAVNHAKETTTIELPYTVGRWDKTKPVQIRLAKGKNSLLFSRAGDNVRGLTIKDFTLTPIP